MIKHTTSRSIRRVNQLAVLQHIYAAAPITRQELTTHSGLSTATVSNVVGDLLKTGIVFESGFQSSHGGRPRAVLNINAASGYFIGIDVTETYVHFELFDMMLHHQGTIEHALHHGENQPDQVVQHLVDGIAELIAAHGIARSSILGVGISVPGLVERLGGVSVFAPNWGWHDVPLADMLRGHSDLPLYLDNPLKATATAELWFGEGRHVRNLVTLTIGTGVGAGIILDGKLLRGPNNSAGEWGHTVIVPDGRPCRCGNRGCVEAYVGAPGILQHVRDRAPNSALLQDDEMASIHALAAAAEAGDALALQVMHDTARYLGIGIANVINMLNPELIVISGWAGMLLGPHLLPLLHEPVERHTLQPPREQVAIRLCQIRHNPSSLGSATFALEGYLAVNEADELPTNIAVLKA